VKSIPSEVGPFVLASAIMAVIFLAALIRVWLLRRVEEKLLKTKDKLEAQVIAQQKDLMQVRSDANAWRAEMQRQFDLFRHMASDQLQVEEKRFDDLLTKSREREQHLQMSLDIAKQMCVELPGTKARLMQLESIVGLDGGEHLSAEPSPPPAARGFSMAQLPDLDGANLTAPAPEAALVPAVIETTQAPESSPEIEAELRHLQQQNSQLQQALTAARLRSRIRERQSQQRGRNGKH
jgi:hypothetical protein